jgi:ABC-2 type transport system permease protein
MRRVGVVAVAAREVGWIRRDPVALLLTLVAPLVAFALLAGTFSNSVIRQLHIDVVDVDRSATSNALIQAIDAAPGVTVALRSTDLTSALHTIRSGQAIAAVYIPENFERDFLSNRRPQVVNFYNRQFFTPGNIAASGVQAAVSAAVATLPQQSLSHSWSPGPLVVEQYALNNPALNYVQFLVRAIMPTVLHVMIAIAGAFSVGSEFGRRRVMSEWLETAGGSPLAAIIGKFAPYCAIFLSMMVVVAAILHAVFNISFRGDPTLVAAAAFLLIVAYYFLGAFFVLLVRNLAVGLSLTGIVCSPAFGFAGVGFPAIAIDGFAKVWGSLLPLRWYVQILFDQGARGAAAQDSLPAFWRLAGLAAVLFALAWLRARTVLRKPPKPEERTSEPEFRGPLVSRAFAGEYLRVLRDKGAFGLIIVGPLIYAALYPQPYVGQLVRDIPIGVVDDDHTEISRTITQALDAHEAIAVKARPLNLSEAQDAIGRREIFGVVQIPAGTERDVLAGRRARIPAFVDAAYFLLYNRTLQGVSEAVGAASADLQTRSARQDGSLYRAALIKTSPVEFLAEPLFNPTGGYAAYIVPAAFILILQQTLALGVATLGGVAYETGGKQARRMRGRPSAVLGQALAHLLLALPLYALYLIILPRVYGFASTRRVLDLLVFLIPFVLSVSLLGQFAGAAAKRRETAVIVLIAFGLPLFFLVGVAWPLEAIPPLLRVASAALPSTFGIDGLVRINQMGASLADVWPDWRALWILAAAYAALTILATRGRASLEARQ